MSKQGRGKKKVRIVTKRGAPVYKYLCSCHNEAATKMACAMPDGARVGESIVYRDGEKSGHAPKGESTLGSWRCAKTNKPCKVSRQRNVAESTPETAVQEVGNVL